jgi:hypothetical protein
MAGAGTAPLGCNIVAAKKDKKDNGQKPTKIDSQFSLFYDGEMT